jgi:hypothetical protein
VAALSIERYIDARAILTARFRSLITMVTLFFIWALGLLLPLPFIMFTYLDKSYSSSGNRSMSPPKAMFSCESRLTERQLLVHEIILYVVAFIIPYSIIVIFSLKLLKFLRDWLNRKQKLTRTSVAKKRTRGVKLVLCIVLSFLVCYTPFWAFKFYTRHLVDDDVAQRPLLQRFLYYMHSLVVLLNHFEGLLNPLFFILLTERFCLTFSKHRQRRSRLFGPISSIGTSTTTRRMNTRSVTTAGIKTDKHAEINSLLLSNHHQQRQQQQQQQKSKDHDESLVF